VSASLVGQRLGKYEITELLGHGGMATVYKAYRPDIDRYVAIKVLPPHPGQDGQFVERFRLEARTVARLQHPHILPLYDYGDENDVLYLVMAYIDGGSLSDRIRKGAMPVDEAQNFFQQIASALDYAHRQNVIHRDIKPDNILIDSEGHALLSDFGIVKIIEQAAGTLNLTGTGGLVGTPAYMSPEQAQGLPIDRRSDIYSLGIVVYEMMTGKQPFTAETPMQVVLKHITEPPPSLCRAVNELPLELDQVMEQALVKNPIKRYSTASEFYEDFARVLRGEKPMSPSATLNLQNPTPIPGTSGETQVPVGTVQLQPTVVTQSAWNPLILLGGFAIIALLVVAVVVIILNFNREENTLPPTRTSATQVVAVPVNTAPTFGRVSYSTANTLGDSVNVQVNALTQPPSGSVYTVWLHNTDSQASLKLGDVRLDALGDGQLSYTDNDGAILPTLYNAVLITEQPADDTTTPSDRVVYSGSIPHEVMSALEEILISSEDGINEATPFPRDPETGEENYDIPPLDNSSLISGALLEAEIARQHAGLAADSTSVGSLHTHAEHTINILRGTYDDYNGNGRGESPGRGYGIPYFLDRIEARLNEVASAPTATRFIQSQIELIRVCSINARNWVEQIVEIDGQLLASEDLNAVQPQLVELTRLAAAIVDGTDLNQNGQVEPFEGECGLSQITTFGVSVGNVDILAGSLPEGE
jgi:serine/threonine-protein kinase